MATDRRVARVAESIKREVGQLLFSGIKDDRVGMGIVSVTDVQVAGDLQHAKIFVSIYGTPEAKASAMAGLKSATGFVRSELGQRIRLRRTPEVVFIEDISFDRGTKVLSLINQLSRERKDIPESEGDRWEVASKSESAALEDDDLEDDLDDDIEDGLENDDLEDDLEENDLDDDLEDDNFVSAQEK
ncbi:MAG: 30S ribosome-binding factor RbfA [Drouetiella hepatica Uher 2000/2452]|jgi:ribosome-binding factor A|uniref:Ribosome-binding factor A n=1 Tax=Drouetiella hepatica Uher 2000/2452 TaxID=904376 RepID=A0A951QDA0_9CYAN|nr:30S ribosome-binding factor RbfA [Drouetiella hepatica Uher 2000/2452]